MDCCSSTAMPASPSALGDRRDGGVLLVGPGDEQAQDQALATLGPHGVLGRDPARLVEGGPGGGQVAPGEATAFSAGPSRDGGTRVRLGLAWLGPTALVKASRSRARATARRTSGSFSTAHLSAPAAFMSRYCDRDAPDTTTLTAGGGLSTSTVSGPVMGGTAASTSPLASRAGMSSGSEKRKVMDRSRGVPPQ